MKAPPFLLATALLTGCAVHLPEPDDAMAGGDPKRLQHLREGRDLYVAKCSGCHSLMAPSRFSDASWHREVQEMVTSKKVRLSPLEQDRIVTYLTGANDVP